MDAIFDKEGLGLVQLDIALKSRDYWIFSDIAGTGRKKNRTYLTAINSLFWLAMGFLGMHLIRTGAALDFSAMQWAKGPGLFIVLMGLRVDLPMRWNRRVFEPIPDGHTLGRRTYDFSPAGIDVSNERFSFKYQWSAIVDFVDTDNHFFLFLDSTAALIIPKRAFDSVDSLSTFEKMVVEFTGLRTNKID